MVKLRLQRTGKKNFATFRLVAADSKSPVKGKFIELLGNINPHKDKVVLKEERIKYWLSVGAQPSRTVHNLLVDKEILKADKIKITAKSKSKEEEGEEKKESPKEEKGDEKSKEAEKEPKPEAESKPQEEKKEDSQKSEAYDKKEPVKSEEKKDDPKKEDKEEKKK